MLLFKHNFLPLVRAGIKTQTLRLWIRPRVKIGQRAYVPGLHKNPARSRLRILAIDPVNSLNSLTRADALADGFPSRRALLAELRRLYPALKSPHNPRHLFRIRFAYNSGRKPGAKPLPHKTPRPSLHEQPTASPRPAKSPPSPPSPHPSSPIPHHSDAARRQLANFLRHPPSAIN